MSVDESLARDAVRFLGFTAQSLTEVVTMYAFDVEYPYPGRPREARVCLDRVSSRGPAGPDVYRVTVLVGDDVVANATGDSFRAAAARALLPVMRALGSPDTDPSGSSPEP